MREETRGKVSQLTEQFDKDRIHFSLFRRDISEALASSRSDNLIGLDEWIFFLKPRIERLEYWSALLNINLVLFITACGLLSITFATIGPEVPTVVAGIGGVISIIGGVYRFDIEKKKLWYKYVVSHLEAIKSELATITDEKRQIENQSNNRGLTKVIC
jgi:hypothetical protein